MKNFAISKNLKFFALLPAVILVVGIIFFAMHGMNLGIDFTGGTMFTIELNTAYQASDIEAIVDKHVDVGFRVTVSDETAVLIQLQDSNEDANVMNQVRQDLEADLRAAYPEMSEPTVERVGAVAGSEMVRSAIYALLIACVGMLIYITIRFEFWSGVAALVGLLHDVLMMNCLVVILNIQVNSSFIAAVLTIVGYSITNTIVVFDRVRENRRRFGRTMDRMEMADRSIKETLTRSINTAITTLITIGVLCIMGVTSIQEFTLPIIGGLICGTYSSIFLVAPFWAICQPHGEKLKGKAPRKAKP